MELILLVLISSSLINILYAKDIVNHYFAILSLYSFLVIFIINTVERPQALIVIVTVIYALINQIIISLNEKIKNERKEIEEIV